MFFHRRWQMENSRKLFGRKIITTPTTVITSANVIDELKKAMVIHMQNSSDIEYLFRYHRGNQLVWRREKGIRPEINNKIVENHAAEIVSFKTGYVFGEPVIYARRGKDEAITDKINTLNEMMFAEDKASCDKELADNFHICGTSYRMILPDKEIDEDECPFEIDSLDPRYCFVVYNNGFGRRPVMGATYAKDSEGNIVFSIYTPTTYFEIVDSKIEKEIPHVLGDIPIIEYPANAARMGAFELVIGLLDALNELSSNRLDAVEQFVQSLIVLYNCDIDDDIGKNLRALGLIKLTNNSQDKADLKVLNEELNQTQTQALVDYIYQTILTICNMPNRNGGSSTSDTGAAVILRDGWSSAEASAKAVELEFKKPEKRFLKLALGLARDMSNLDLKLSEIDIKFTRRQNDNLLVKVQGLQGLLQSGIDPSIAIATVGLFNDPNDVYLASMKTLTKWLKLSTTDSTTAASKTTDEEQK